MSQVYAIRSTNKMWIYVDEERYEELSGYNWHCAWGGSTYYAIRKTPIFGTRKEVKIHNQIMSPPKGLFVDHRDRFGLNNTDINLRIVTHQQNCQNRGLRKDSTSGYKGVGWNVSMGKWEARINVNDKYIYLGWFNDIAEAALAYDAGAIKYYGEYASLNFSRGLNITLDDVIYPKEFPVGLRGADYPRGTIPLAHPGQFCYVDDEDWDRAIQYKWSVSTIGGKQYVMGHVDGKKVYLHRFILGVADPKLVVDHIHGNTLDNRKSQLEVKDNSGNRFTQRQRTDNTTGFRGVHYNKKTGKYDYEFSCRFKRYRGWNYNTPEEAARGYDTQAVLYGDARVTLNFPEEWGR